MNNFEHCEICKHKDKEIYENPCNTCVFNIRYTNNFEEVEDEEQRGTKMKLIIDIDEERYTYIVNDPFLNNEVYSAIKNGTPLDKIRAEIANLDNLNPTYLSDGRYTIDKGKVLRIIDKYKAERSE